jgi:parallel beta-helix repeat protein
MAHIGLSWLLLFLVVVTPDYKDMQSSDFPYKVFVPVVIQSGASNFYVASSGDDGDAGTLQAPWKTLQHAADHAAPDSVILIRAGTYSGFDLSRPGLTFTSYPGEQVIVAGDSSRSSTIRIRNTSIAAIQNLTIRDNFRPYGTGLHVENASNILIDGNMLRDNQGFGLVLKDVADITVSNNRATGNGCAIEVRYGSANVILRDNQIYANDRVIDSGRAAVGITFYRTTGPVVAQNNLLWDNHSHNEPDPEGGAFEVYAASNITMTGNTIWENEMVLETGTDAAKTPCNNITFTRNTAYRINRQQGLILRCASNSLIAHNTFTGLDKFVFSVSHNNGSYGGSVEGLRIVNNIAVHGRVYSIDSALPASVEINYNLAYNPGSSSNYGKYIAYVAGRGNTSSFAQFQAWTGSEANGINADPLFANANGQDYRLTGSFDKGVVLSEDFFAAPQT